MTLRELMAKCRYKPTFNALQQIYYKKEIHSKILKADIAFLKAWDALESLPPSINPHWKISLEDRKREDQDFIDVCWYSVEEDELYALDFVEWKELIDAEIQALDSTPLTEALAHILWEITFWGFNPTQIKEESLKI